jgi:hypothetical protein
MYRADLLLALEKSAIILACAAACALLVRMALAIRMIGTPGREEPVGPATGAAFVFALLGVVTGFTMGASRVAVVASIVPAALTFIGGLALLIVTGRARSAEAAPQPDGVTLGCAVVSFTLLLFFGLVLGAFERIRAEHETRNLAFDRERLLHEARVEFTTNAFRRSLGLAPRDFAPAKRE